MNDGALGSYIYLLQTKDKNDEKALASMIGEGSVLIIITLAAVSACVVEGLYIIKKKRQYKENHDTGTQSDNEK